MPLLPREDLRPMARPAVFVDRDGTLIEDVDFLTSPEEVRILPRTVPGLRRLRDAGYLIVVITNQSGIARGLLTEADLADVHRALAEHLDMLGCRVDAFYHCPHLPPDHADAPQARARQFVTDCQCRKPRPGMFLQARDELGIDLEHSVALGDAWRDVEAAMAVGVPSIKLPRPAGRDEPPRPDLPLLGEAADIAEAAEIILTTDDRATREEIRMARSRKSKSRRSKRAAKSPPKETPSPAPDAKSSPSEPPPASQVEPSPDEARAVSTPAPTGEDESTAPVAPPEPSDAPEFDASLDASPELERIERTKVPEPAYDEEDRDETTAPAVDDLPQDDGAVIAQSDLFAPEDARESAVDAEVRSSDKTPVAPAPPEEEAAELDEPEHEPSPAQAGKGEEDEREDVEDASPPAATCARCGGEIIELDLTTGSAGEVNDALLCRTCYPEVSRMAARATVRAGAKEAEDAGPRDLEAAVNDILVELRRLVRREGGRGEGSRLARALALAAQPLSFFLAILPLLRWTDEEATGGELMLYVLWAVFMQVFSLTMFMISRKKD